MSKKKNILRIGTILCILLFLLIPLVSFPVAASHTVYLGSVTTDSLSEGTAAGGTAGQVADQIVDTSPFDVNYQVSYSHTEDSGGSLGSRHVIKVIVNWDPANGEPDSITFTKTTLIPVPIGPPTTVTGTWTTPWITGYGGKGTQFSVTFEVHCTNLDYPDDSTSSWYSNTIDYMII